MVLYEARGRLPVARDTAIVPDWNPTKFPGLQFWYRAHTLSGLNDGDPLPSWPDESGLGRTLLQSTPSLQPTYRVSATPSGLPAIEFAPNQFTAKNLKTAAFLPGVLAQPLWFFIVVKKETLSSKALWDGLSSGGRVTVFSVQQTGSRPDYSFNAGGTRPSGLTFEIDPGEWQIFAAYFDHATPLANHKAWINPDGFGGTATTGTLLCPGDFCHVTIPSTIIGGNSMDGLTLGSFFTNATSHIGMIAEIFCYQGIAIPSGLQPNWVAEPFIYLSQIYGIPLSNAPFSGVA